MKSTATVNFPVPAARTGISLFPLDFKFQFAIFLKLAENLISFLHANVSNRLARLAQCFQNLVRRQACGNSYFLFLQTDSHFFHLICETETAKTISHLVGNRNQTNCRLPDKAWEQLKHSTFIYACSLTYLS